MRAAIDQHKPQLRLAFLKTRSDAKECQHDYNAMPINIANGASPTKR
jgi:hypothetical protein